MKVQFIPQVRNKVILPALVSAAVLLGAQGLNAQQKPDTVELTQTELVNNAPQKQKDEKHTGFAIMGAAFILLMGFIGLAPEIMKAMDKHEAKKSNP